jgi:hypothetical protein
LIAICAIRRLPSIDDDPSTGLRVVPSSVEDDDGIVVERLSTGRTHHCRRRSGANFITAGNDVLAMSATFGQIRNAAGPRGGARELEFGLRYEF